MLTVLLMGCSPRIPGHVHSALNGVFTPASLGTLTVLGTRCSYCGTINGSKTFLVNPRAQAETNMLLRQVIHEWLVAVMT